MPNDQLTIEDLIALFHHEWEEITEHDEGLLRAADQGLTNHGEIIASMLTVIDEEISHLRKLQSVIRKGY